MPVFPRHIHTAKVELRVYENHCKEERNSEDKEESSRWNEAKQQLTQWELSELSVSNLIDGKELGDSAFRSGIVEGVSESVMVEGVNESVIVEDMCESGMLTAFCFGLLTALDFELEVEPEWAPTKPDTGSTIEPITKQHTDII